MPALPPRLLPGQTIAILSPSSPPHNPSNIDAAARMLADLGYIPKIMPAARSRHGFLAGSDRQRATDIIRAFSDKSIHAIFCLRGGHGATRLLPLLDFQKIRRHPKIFLGYSDITAIHCALLAHANLVSFHGPMLNADFVTNRLPGFTRESLHRTLSTNTPPGSILRGLQTRNIQTLRPGRATGKLIGGNLTLLCALIGTPWQPSFAKKILFLEDVNETPYRVDRMLTHLLNAGLLRQVAAIAIGNCKNCGETKSANTGEFRHTLADVFSERLRPLKIPIVMGLPFGHVPANATIPLGIRATLDATAGDLIIQEPAVR